MAKVRVTFNQNAFFARIKSTLNGFRMNRQMLGEMGNVVADEARKQATKGSPLNSLRAFPPLAEKTIANRIRLARYNRTSRSFKPSFSNVTFTGQLIKSIGYKVKRSSVIVGPNSKRRKPYITGAKGNKQKLVPGKNKTNLDLAKTLAEKGFILFDDEEIENNPRLLRRLKRIQNRFLKKKLKKSGLKK